MGRKQRKIFFKNNYFNFITAVILTLLFAAANIAIAFVLKNLMDVAYSRSMQEFKSVMYMTVIILIGASVIGLLKLIVTNMYIKKAARQFKTSIFQKIMYKNINSFNKESQSTYISAFSNDLSSIEEKYLAGNLGIINNLALFIGAAVAMAYMNFAIFGIAIAASLIPIIVSIIIGPKLEDMEKKVSTSNAMFVGLTKDLLAGFTVIKSFRAVNEIAFVFNHKNEELESVKRKARDTEGIIATVNDVAGMIVSVAVIGAGVYFAIKGKVTAGVVIAYIDLLNYLLDPISELGVQFANRNAALALVDKLDTIAEQNSNNTGTKEIKGLSDKIVYENVSFGYEDGVNNIFDINVTFEKNKSYAVVGGSGCGKSTLLNLLIGYHSNYIGNIKIDKNEIRDINTESIYDVVSIIQQNVFVFDNSIADNITLFKEFEQVNIDSVIKRAGLEKLIKDKGQEYRCGENGSNLSGGEKQRISIARSLLRGTPILLMDEATAALDSETSYMIEEAILSIKELTKIIVTHRMNVNLLNKYDEIIVMNQGTIVEKGNFKELIERKGHFYSLYSIANSSQKNTK